MLSIDLGPEEGINVVLPKFSCTPQHGRGQSSWARGKVLGGSSRGAFQLLPPQLEELESQSLSEVLCAGKQEKSNSSSQ